MDYGTSSQATARPAESFPFRTPTMEQTHNLMLDLQESVDDDDEIRRLTPIGRPSSRPSLRHSWMDDQRRSNRHPYPRSEESTEGIYRTSGRLFGALTGKIGEIFTPKWRRTTVLMWLIWGATSLGELHCREEEGKRRITNEEVCQPTPCSTPFCRLSPQPSSEHSRTLKAISHLPQDTT